MPSDLAGLPGLLLITVYYSQWRKTGNNINVLWVMAEVNCYMMDY